MPQPRWRTAPIRIAMCAALLAGPLVPAVRAQDDAAARRELLTALQTQLRADDLAAARSTARRYLELDPSHPDVWYNLAGLESQLGDAAAAQAAFAEAVALGFDDFRHAETDADLGALRDSARFAQLRDAWRRGLRERQAARRLDLAAGAWSTPVTLPDREGGLVPPRVTVRLRPGPDALAIEATVDGAAGDVVRPPWQGGAGLVVAVAMPAGDDAVDATVFREVAFGFQQKLPAGAVLVRGRRTFWQRLGELTPTVRDDPATGRQTWEATFPWAILAPYHPLAEPGLGLNLTWLASAGRERAALIGDPAAGDPEAGYRRFVPVDIDWSGVDSPVFAGRVDAAVARGDSLHVTLVTAAPVPGTVRLEMQLLPLIGDTDTRVQRLVETAVPAGRHEIPLTADLDALPTGPVRLQAAATFSGGESRSWGTGILRLPRGWEASLGARVDALPSLDRQAVRLRLDAVRQELAARPPRRDPGPLAMTVTEILALLDRYDATGTVFPDSGPFLTAMPAAAGLDPRPCSLELPAGFSPRTTARVLVILMAAGGDESRVADLARGTLAEQRDTDPGLADLLIAVPHDAAPAATAGARQALAWVRSSLPGAAIYVAGMDRLAGAALAAVLDRPDGVAGLLLAAGRDLDLAPGPELDARLAAAAPRAHTLSIRWLAFTDEIAPDDDGPDRVRRALERAGLGPVTVETVPGGLALGQAAGRAALWAAAAAGP